MCKDYVEYNNFDELPEKLKEKFKSRAKGLKLDEAKNGYLGFINQLNQQGDELVGDYVTTTTKTQVRFGWCGHVADISPDKYKIGIGCGVCNGKQVQRGVNDLGTLHPDLVKGWHSIKNGELTPCDVTQGSNKKVWWHCKQGHEWEARIADRICGNDCPYCSNQKVLKGFNDIGTSHTHYVKYFVNVEDAYTHTHSSGKKVELKCPDCGHTKTMSIGTLTRYGFGCVICSDGVSYPEKLTASILNRLEIEFTKQLSFDNGEHKYDFYLPHYNAILETHGEQHYEQQGRGRSLEEEQENDRYKRVLAIDYEILNENYHEVDCRYSTLEWCRPNIEQALSNYINMSALTDEDWRQADIQAQKSLKIEVCKYWKENKEVEGDLTVQRVADYFGMEVSSIRNYLKWGNAIGFCTYNGKEEREASHRRRSTFVYLIRQDGEKWFDNAISMIELERQTGISQTTIKNNLDKGALKYSNSAKYPKEYIGSYIVSAEVYDSQNQTNQNT